MATVGQGREATKYAGFHTGFILRMVHDMQLSEGEHRKRVCFVNFPFFLCEKQISGRRRKKNDKNPVD